MMLKAFVPVHPDDLLLFNEIRQAMLSVAKEYHLPVKAITGMPNPDYRWSPLGDCSASGDIRLVMRGMTSGEWDAEPRREDDVWKTAAHELAHLRHMNHGVAFQEFEVEMNTAINNRRVDHRQKIINKLLKMQKSREGEAHLGNMAAAESFAAAINKMLIEHELNPSDLDFARASGNDPIMEIAVHRDGHQFIDNDGKIWKLESKKTRVAWQETLARIVANAHLCSFLIQLHTNNITFVGTKSHATVAEYVYGTLAVTTEAMARIESYIFRLKMKKAGDVKRARGFHEAWLAAFIDRIGQRFADARREAIKTVTHDVPGAESQALVRLNGSLAKVQRYMDDKFQKERKYASALTGPRGYHEEGTAAGRAAADRMPIGRRGVSGSRSPRGQIGSGE